MAVATLTSTQSSSLPVHSIPGPLPAAAAAAAIHTRSTLFDLCPSSRGERVMSVLLTACKCNSYLQVVALHGCHRSALPCFEAFELSRGEVRLTNLLGSALWQSALGIPTVAVWRGGLGYVARLMTMSGKLEYGGGK